MPLKEKEAGLSFSVGKQGSSKGRGREEDGAMIWELQGGGSSLGFGEAKKRKLRE